MPRIPDSIARTTNHDAPRLRIVTEIVVAIEIMSMANRVPFPQKRRCRLIGLISVDDRRDESDIYATRPFPDQRLLSFYSVQDVQYKAFPGSKCGYRQFFVPSCRIVRIVPGTSEASPSTARQMLPILLRISYFHANSPTRVVEDLHPRIILCTDLSLPSMSPEVDAGSACHSIFLGLRFPASQFSLPCQ